MKVGITVDDELMARADKYADENFMSRSGLISVALNQYLSAQATTRAIIDISLAMRKIADTGKVDHEDLEKLEDFERLAKVFLQARSDK